jgi:CheY-like chemotaxis protein
LSGERYVSPEAANSPDAGESDHPVARVLVADDDREAADVLAEVMRTLGCDAQVAYDGDEAVTLARRYRPHLAILDLGMPRMNGYEAARRIRAEPRGDIMRIVALSGWGRPEDRRQAAEAGFDQHLVKPARIEDLEALARSATGLAAQRGA